METQEVIDCCAARNDEINRACERVVNKDVRYRFVIDMASLLEGVTNGATERGITSFNRQTVPIQKSLCRSKEEQKSRWPNESPKQDEPV